jgi:hypothetical protein
MREPLKWIDPVQEALPPSAKDVASLTSISAAHHLPATRTDYYMASRFDLSAAAGNRARAVKSYRVAFERPGWSIRVDTRLELTSTLGVHHIVWKIEAVESGMRIHSVEHATSVNWDVPDPA